jgi:hypothetical protein
MVSHALCAQIDPQQRDGRSADGASGGGRGRGVRQVAGVLSG